MFDKDNKFGFINNNESNNNIEGLDNIKTDIKNIKDDVGNEELTTTAKDLKGAINELDTQYKDIAKKLNFIIPENFGAKGDGITDDTNAIQNTLNYASSNNLSVFLKRKYYIKSLKIPPNVIIIGNNAEIIASSNTTPIIINGENVIVDNFKINGNNKCDNCIEIQKNTNNINLINMEITKANSLGILSVGTDNLSIINCNIHENGINDSTETFTIGGCRLNSKNVLFKNNIVDNNYGCGVILSAKPADNFIGESIIVDNCIISNNKLHGIASLYRNDNIKNVTINNNDVFNNGITGKSGSGIATHFLNNQKITNNYVHDNHEHGIVLMDCKSSIIENNIIKNNQSCGIRLQGELDSPQDDLTGVFDTVVINNEIYNYKFYGIWIGQNSHNCTFEKNIINTELNPSIMKYPIVIQKTDNYTTPYNLFLNDNRLNQESSNYIILEDANENRIYGENFFKDKKAPYFTYLGTGVYEYLEHSLKKGYTNIIPNGNFSSWDNLNSAPSQWVLLGGTINNKKITASAGFTIATRLYIGNNKPNIITFALSIKEINGNRWLLRIRQRTIDGTLISATPYDSIEFHPTYAKSNFHTFSIELNNLDNSCKYLELSLYNKSDTEESIELNYITANFSDTPIDSSCNTIVEMIKYGETSTRPLICEDGYCFFDTTLGKPIWKHSSGWKDIEGKSV